MADVHSKKVRSYNMSMIKGKNTKPEMMVRKFLFSKGFRYRLHDKNLPGKPDLILPKHQTVIFVNGCFWHGHEVCSYFVVPKTRTNWWIDKILGTKRRDELHDMILKKKGWKVITIWECELKNENKDSSLNQLLKKIVSNGK